MTTLPLGTIIVAKSVREGREDATGERHELAKSPDVDGALFWYGVDYHCVDCRDIERVPYDDVLELEIVALPAEKLRDIVLLDEIVGGTDPVGTLDELLQRTTP